MAHDRNENQPENRPIHGVSTAQEQGSEADKTNPSKITSPARVAANQRNAQKSTGPKTSEGKARSRWNAVQHGLLAKRLFTRDESDRSSFDHLLESLREDWQPDGTLEEILLEKIAIGYYKLHVVYGYEAEYARRSGEFFLTIDRTGRYATSINRQLTQDVNHFERLQRQRKGEFVPAPISIDLIVSSLDEGALADTLQTVKDSSATASPVSMGSDVPHLSRAADESQFVGPHDLARDRTTSSDPLAAAELSSAGSTTPQLTAGHVHVEGEPPLETISEAAEDASRTAEVPTSPQTQDE
jgi:hypothetical protein